MKWITRLPVVRDLYARGLLFPAVLILAVLGVLVHGAFQDEASAEAVAETQPLLAPVEVPGIRPDLEKSPLTYFSDYYRQLGEKVRNKLVLLGRDQIPGVVVAPGVALTTLEAADGIDAEDETHEVLGLDTERGLALIAVKQDDPDASFSSVSYAVLTPGSSIVAVSLGPDGRVRVTPGSVVSLSTTTEGFLDVAVPFSDFLEAAALVDLDAGLIGVAIRTSRGIEVISREEVNMLVDRLAKGPACQAIEVSDMTDGVREALRLGGVVVEKVRRNSFLPEPSIRAGDVLLSWNGEAVENAEQFASLYQAAPPGELVRYAVWRSGRRVTGRTRMPQSDCRPMDDPPQTLTDWGIVLRWDRGTGWRVVELTEHSPAAEAGVMEDDLIVAVDGVALSGGDIRKLRRLERNTKPVVLTLRRGNRVKLAAVNSGTS